MAGISLSACNVLSCRLRVRELELLVECRRRPYLQWPREVSSVVLYWCGGSRGCCRHVRSQGFIDAYARDVVSVIDFCSVHRIDRWARARTRIYVR